MSKSSSLGTLQETKDAGYQEDSQRLGTLNLWGVVAKLPLCTL